MLKDWVIAINGVGVGWNAALLIQGSSVPALTGFCLGIGLVALTVLLWQSRSTHA